jgi:hypothetical protein
MKEIDHSGKLMLRSRREVSFRNLVREVGNGEVIVYTSVSFGPDASGKIKELSCLNRRPKQSPEDLQHSWMGAIGLKDQIHMGNSQCGFDLLIYLQRATASV